MSFLRSLSVEDFLRKSYGFQIKAMRSSAVKAKQATKLQTSQREISNTKWYQFKKDFQKIESALKNKKEFRRELRKFITAPQFEKIPSGYAINELLAKGSHWYDCYIYQDIILIYRIDSTSLTLQKIGRIRDLYK
jgi:mRNA-degrading endonuclease YafQ of YafQ-DinJ toxin-antitoxin module